LRSLGTSPEVEGVLLDDQTTKSEAGKRLVGVPGAIVPDLRKHLDKWSEAGAHGRVFVGPKGRRPLRSNYSRYWRDAVEKAGLIGLGLHFHDLRHTANDFAARETNVKELMAHMGHANARAALVYQDVDPQREREIAQALSKKIEGEEPDRSGTEVARGQAVRAGGRRRPWWARRDSNPRHLPCKGSALAN
jgi:integrase